jgi:hypothetical protein
MATLLELYTIESNSQLDPNGAPPEVVSAVELRHRIRTAILKQSNVIIRTPLPSDDRRGDALEMLAWAQRTVDSPDAQAMSVLRLVLAANAGAQVSTILSVTDAQIESAVVPVLGLMSKGMVVGRR